MFLPIFLSGVEFFNLDLCLFLSQLYGTQVYSFAAIPAIGGLCLVLAFKGGYTLRPTSLKQLLFTAEES